MVTAKHLFILLLILISVILPSQHSLSAPNEARWTQANIPSEGISGKWTLANGSDISHLTMANDGTLYCYANPSGTIYTLFKSIDAGRTWTTIGNVTDTIIDIACLPQDSTNIYYATASQVYKSTDTGNTFIPLPPNPGNAGNDNISISSIDVVCLDNSNIVAVGTTDNDTSEYGGVYLLLTGSASWADTNIGSYDVCRVAFSPHYSLDRQLTAVASDEVNTTVRTKIYTGDWGQMYNDAVITGIVPSSAVITFPPDYKEITDNSSFLVGIDTGTGNGDVFRITPGFIPSPSAVTDLNTGIDCGFLNVDITSLAIGKHLILAGSADTASVYISNNDGSTWQKSTKPPTGQRDTCLLIAPDFETGDTVFAVTKGTESAFSYSNDGGITWNQISLIDTEINNINDLAAPLPSTVFIMTFNDSNLKHSIWRTTDSGTNWERIFCSNSGGIDTLNSIYTASQDSINDALIFLTGQKDGNPLIWKSTDNGQNFIMSIAPCNIDTMVIINANTWFIGGYDGSNGLIYRTTNGGIFYEKSVKVGTRPFSALITSPDYGEDNIVLAGNTIGEVYMADNDSLNFSLLGQPLPVDSGIGRISLAFDSDFAENRIIYAATDAEATPTGKDRIFRFTVGQNTDWQSIYGSLPEHAVIKEVIITGDGTLYALNDQDITITDNKGGVLRSLSPSSSPTFETMLNGLEDAASLKDLAICENRLRAIDVINVRLMTFSDGLTLPVTLVSPEDEASGLTTADFKLDWQNLDGATEYEWQISKNSSFSNIPAELSGTAQSSSVYPAGLEPAAVYYWRIRATAPYLSRWSETWSFTIILGGDNTEPVLNIPEAGVITNTNPIFQWNTIVSADRYDLLIAKDCLFTDIVVDKTGNNALFSNVWQCDTNLENDTTYYWKVKARSENSSGIWSGGSAFVTESIPLVLTSAASTEIIVSTVTPAALTQAVTDQPPVNVNINIPTWLLYTGISLLGAIVLILGMLVVTNLKRRY